MWNFNPYSSEIQGSTLPSDLCLIDRYVLGADSGSLRWSEAEPESAGNQKPHIVGFDGMQVEGGGEEGPQLRNRDKMSRLWGGHLLQGASKGPEQRTSGAAMTSNAQMRLNGTHLAVGGGGTIASVFYLMDGKQPE